MKLTLEQQLTNLELSKKMRELGFPQESCYYWNEIKREQRWTWVLETEPKSMKGVNGLSYSAYTVAELGEMLKSVKETYFTVWGKIPPNISKKRWIAHGYVQDVDKYYTYPFAYKFVANTEANARAKMAIYLKEQGLI